MTDSNFAYMITHKNVENNQFVETKSQKLNPDDALYDVELRIMKRYGIKKEEFDATFKLLYIRANT